MWVKEKERVRERWGVTEMRLCELCLNSVVADCNGSIYIVTLVNMRLCVFFLLLRFVRCFSFASFVDCIGVSSAVYVLCVVCVAS